MIWLEIDHNGASGFTTSLPLDLKFHYSYIPSPCYFNKFDLIAVLWYSNLNPRVHVLGSALSISDWLTACIVNKRSEISD